MKLKLIEIKKKGLVTTKVIENAFVVFVINPSKGVENLYTIKIKKVNIFDY